MRWLIWGAVGIGAALGVAGCGPDQNTDFAACRMDSFKVYAAARGDAVYNEAADYTMYCMETKGYAVTWEACPINRYITPSDVVTMSKCYQKKRFWEAPIGGN